MLADPAADHYFVRFGELRFGELVLEALAAIGFDPFDTAPLGSPFTPAMSAVVEIVDRLDGRVVRRIRDDAAVVSELHDCIAKELHRIDVAAFASAWLVPDPDSAIGAGFDRAKLAGQ